MSQFEFLEPEWPQVLASAKRADANVHADPRAACFYARRALELAVHWAYKHDAALKLPYQDNLPALIHDLLTRCNWAKRVLFLADRVVLVRQAVNAFKAFLPDASPVNLVADKHADGRVYVSTYPTMLTPSGNAATFLQATCLYPCLMPGAQPQLAGVA